MERLWPSMTTDFPRLGVEVIRRRVIQEVRIDIPVGLELTELFDEPRQQIRGTWPRHGVHGGGAIGIERWALHRRGGLSDVRDSAKASDARLGRENGHCEEV